MEAFWAKGYEATSVADLCACTGLHKGSLYQAFGDKHTLFMSALKHYADSSFRDVAAVAFRFESPLENLRAAVRRICDEASNEKGCMMINAIVELAPHDPEVRELLRSFANMRIRALAGMIEKAQEAGEISVRQPAEDLARLLMMSLAGAATMVKGVFEPEHLGDSISKLIDSWV